MSTLFPISRNAYHAEQPAFTASSRHSQFGSTSPMGYRASLFYGEYVMVNTMITGSTLIAFSRTLLLYDVLEVTVTCNVRSDNW